jgi:hypothetical protein
MNAEELRSAYSLASTSNTTSGDVGGEPDRLLVTVPGHGSAIEA